MRVRRFLEYGLAALCLVGLVWTVSRHSAEEPAEETQEVTIRPPGPLEAPKPVEVESEVPLISDLSLLPLDDTLVQLDPLLLARQVAVAISCDVAAGDSNGLPVRGTMMKDGSTLTINLYVDFNFRGIGVFMHAVVTEGHLVTVWIDGDERGPVKFDLNQREIWGDEETSLYQQFGQMMKARCRQA